MSYFELGQGANFKLPIFASPFGTGSSLAATILMLQSGELPANLLNDVCQLTETWTKLIMSPTGQNFVCLNSLATAEYAEVADAADKVPELKLDKRHAWMHKDRLVQAQGKDCSVNANAAKIAVEQQKRAERIVRAMPKAENIDSMCPLDERRYMFGKPFGAAAPATASAAGPPRPASLVELDADAESEFSVEFEETEAADPQYMLVHKQTESLLPRLQCPAIPASPASAVAPGPPRPAKPASFIELESTADKIDCATALIGTFSATSKIVPRECELLSSAEVMVNLKNRVEDPATDLTAITKLESMMKFFETNKLVHFQFRSALPFAIDVAAASANGQLERLFAFTLTSWGFKAMQADTISLVKAAEAKKSTAEALAAFIKHLETHTEEPARSAIIALSAALSKEATTGVMKAEMMNTPAGKAFIAARADFRAALSPDVFRSRQVPNAAVGLSREMLDFFEAVTKEPLVRLVAKIPCAKLATLSSSWVDLARRPSGFFDSEDAATLLWHRAVATGASASRVPSAPSAPSAPAPAAPAPATPAAPAAVTSAPASVASTVKIAPPTSPKTANPANAAKPVA